MFTFSKAWCKRISFLIIIEDKSQEFKVHKSILIGRSKVFASMLLNSNLSERSDNALNIKDLKPDALKEMLRFLYTDEVFIYVGFMNSFLSIAYINMAICEMGLSFLTFCHLIV